MHVGVMGCGQLARMMALAGWNMGIRFSFLAEQGETTDCVEGLGRIVTRQAGVSAQSVYAALGEPDVVTVEREHVDTALLRELKAFCRVYPDPDFVRNCQDRLLEKEMLAGQGIPTAPHIPANTALQVADAVDRLSLPVVIKTREQGYDGKGQWRITSQQVLREFCAQHRAGDWLVELHVPFEREVSIIAARSANGEVALYPVTENRHDDGILLTSLAPADELAADLLEDARVYMRRLLEGLDYVGVLAMECFVTADAILVNELAPRVHNSGHWTMTGEPTSQFENHLRAILGMQLGSVSVTRYQGMVNVLGGSDRGAVLHELSPESVLFDYNKVDKAGRKLGHINVCCDKRDAVVLEMNRLKGLLYRDAGELAGQGAMEQGARSSEVGEHHAA